MFYGSGVYHHNRPNEAILMTYICYVSLVERLHISVVGHCVQQHTISVLYMH